LTKERDEARAVTLALCDGQAGRAAINALWPFQRDLVYQWRKELGR
jgi:hypothetical protein